MDFSLSPDQVQLRDAVADLCARFDDAYWLRKDRDRGFPEEFHRAVAEGGWLGIAMPRSTAARGLASPRPRS